MTALNCHEIETLYDLYKDELCSPDVRSTVSHHLESCASCSERFAFWDRTAASLSSWQPTTDNALDDRRIIVKVLQQVDGARQPNTDSRSRWLRPLAAAAAVLLVAAAAAGYFYFSSDRDTIANEGLSAPNPPLMTATPDGRIQLALSRDTQVWMPPRTAATIEKQSETEVILKLDRGTVLVNIRKHPPGYRFIVRTPLGTVEALGTVFSVEVDNSGNETTRVLRGTVAASDGSSRVFIRADEQYAMGSPAPVALAEEGRDDANCLMNGCEHSTVEATTEHADAPAASESPAESETASAVSSSERAPNAHREIDEDAIVTRAVALRNEGNPEGAAHVYQELIEASPASAASASARVSIGYLMLRELNNPDQARRWFSDYLRRWPKGSMSEEARLGVVRALQKQNNANGVIVAAQEFESRHPSAFAIHEVRLARADALRSLNQCAKAVELYNGLLSGASGSIRESATRESLRAPGEPIQSSRSDKSQPHRPTTTALIGAGWPSTVRE